MSARKKISCKRMQLYQGRLRLAALSRTSPTLQQLTPLTVSRMIEHEKDMESPTAPLFSPLTPLVKRSMTIEHEKNAALSRTSPALPQVTPLTVSRMIEHEKDMESPTAPLFSPLTPLVKRSMTIEHERIEENSSPIPDMSPGTLELFETLNEEYQSSDDLLNNLEESYQIDIKDAIATKSNVMGCKKSNAYDEDHRRKIESNDEATDFSCDTDSDYVLEDKEDSDDTNSDAICEKKRKKIILKKCNTQDSTADNGSKDVIATRENNDENEHGEIHDSQAQNKDSDHLNQPSECLKGRPKKGRKIKYAEHTLAQTKERKYTNLPYHTKKKKVESKVFSDYACACTRQCFVVVSKEKRKAEFDKFIALESYETQALYIVNYVKESQKARSYTTTQNKSGKERPKTYKRSYSIGDIEVCKDMFLHTFQISSKKVDISLKKKRSGGTFKDQRGQKQGGWNKTPEEDIDFIKIVINSLPKYVSHYRRENNNECQYLKPGMTIPKIYEIYEHGPSKKPVSFETLKRIFYGSFNLRCKTLKKDTCNKCDALTHKIKNCTLVDEKQKLKEEKDTHLRRAQDLRKQMNDDLLRAKTDKRFECVTYDLEKTLPLPRIPTNLVFYKRQLWLYNSGIHVGSSDTGICNVWLEGEAGRGSQEVGSCLLRFIKTDLDQEVEDLVLWSDCCGGQNRNIKITLMLKVALSTHPSLKTITFKYLESGHTFLPNDTDFSKIEYQLKYHERIYTAEEYINVMKSCRKKNPLQVKRMQKEDFISVSKIEKKIVNRKTFVTKEQVNWLNTKEILLKKDKKYAIFMKSFDGLHQELNIIKTMKKKILEISEDDFELLWPNGKQTAQTKLDDLRSMYDLIPKDCLEFYKTLRGNSNILDDVDGFGGEPDFEIIPEEDNNNEENIRV